LKCFGYNNERQLGYDDNNNRGYKEGEMGDNLPVIQLGLTNEVKQVSIGDSHTCAIRIDNVLLCWGRNAFGQIGLGNIDSPISNNGNLVPIYFGEGIFANKISLGSFHTCALLNDNQNLKCWGLNHYGQLGYSDTNSRGIDPQSSPFNISAIDLGVFELNVSSMELGEFHTCIAFIENSVKCFGYGRYGRLGSGSTSNVGDKENQMGSNLFCVDIFEDIPCPTLSPTYSPTILPSNSPTTVSPTSSSDSPTSSPTISPTISPSSSPTTSPILTECDFNKKKKCKKDKACKWKNKKCSLKPIVYCSSLMKKRTCKKEKTVCKWNRKNKNNDNLFIYSLNFNISIIS